MEDQAFDWDNANKKHVGRHRVTPPEVEQAILDTEAIMIQGSGGSMIGNMVQVHMTEAELAQNLHAVLEKVRNGEEIFVEQDRRPFAIIRAPEKSGRPIDECITIAKAYEARLGYAPPPGSFPG